MTREPFAWPIGQPVSAMVDDTLIRTSISPLKRSLPANQDSIRPRDAIPGAEGEMVSRPIGRQCPRGPVAGVAHVVDAVG